MAYVYRHIRLDKNEPFYIGISSDINYSRAYESKKSSRNHIWHSIVSKTNYEVEIIIDNIEYTEALNKEKEFILLYGRIDKHNGILSNLTDGGEGVLGLKHSNKTKEILKIKATGYKHTKESLKKISESGKRPQAQETKDKISKANKGKKRTEEQNKNFSKIRKGFKLSDSAKEKLRIANTGKKYSQETKDKIRRIVTEIWAKRKAGSIS